jgi:hypothetical protein
MGAFGLYRARFGLGSLTGRVLRCSKDSCCGVAEAVTTVERDTMEAVGECARLFGRLDCESALRRYYQYVRQMVQRRGEL